MRTLFLAVGVLIGAASAHGADGQGIFNGSCALCHGRDGKGKTPAGKKFGAKDLTESKLSDAEIEKQIVAGTKDARGNSRMPAFKENLSPEEISAVAAYVKSLRK